METETKAEVIEEVKTVKKVVFDPDKWDVIYKYLCEINIPFGSGKRTAIVEEAVATAMLIDLTLNENEQK